MSRAKQLVDINRKNDTSFLPGMETPFSLGRKYMLLCGGHFGLLTFLHDTVGHRHLLMPGSFSTIRDDVLRKYGACILKDCAEPMCILGQDIMDVIFGWSAPSDDLKALIAILEDSGPQPGMSQALAP
jgi:hypothetical protein